MEIVQTAQNARQNVLDRYRTDKAALEARINPADGNTIPVRVVNNAVKRSKVLYDKLEKTQEEYTNNSTFDNEEEKDVDSADWLQ